MRIKKLVAATTLALTALAVPAGAQAGVLFDPDGALGPLPAQDLGSMSWSITSGLALNGNAAIAIGPGATFDILTHARLVGTTDQEGNPNTPAGLNSTFEITMIARFQEMVTAVSGSTAFFETTGAGISLLELYHDILPPVVPGTASADLSGSGFNNGDLILRGTVVPAGIDGSFTVSSAIPVQFDQFPSNTNANDNYGDGTASTPPTGLPTDSQSSVTGSGSNDPIPVGGITQDFAFFITPLATFGMVFANVSQSLPFTGVNPSDCFTDESSGIPVPGPVITAPYDCAPIHMDRPYSGQGPDVLGGTVPNTGPVNGLFAPSAGPDFVFQTNFAATVIPAPEPGSLALLGLGLAALGFGALRRRRAKQD